MLLIRTSGLHGEGTSIEFYREVVEIEVSADSRSGYRLLVRGDYHFRNLSSEGAAQMIFYPFPIGESDHYPEEIVGIDRSEEGRMAQIAFRVQEKGIAFLLSISPLSTKVLRIRYIQHLDDARATYITTTTSAWGKPLERAEFSVRMPVHFRLMEMSYPPDRMEYVGGTTAYFMAFSDFLPEEDLVFTWEVPGQELPLPESLRSPSDFDRWEVESAWRRLNRPPLGPRRIVLEASAGVLGGLLFGFAALYPLGFVVLPFTCEDGGGEECAFEALAVTGGVGYGIGNGIGVYLVGDNEHDTGSFWASLTGGVVGALVGGVTAYKISEDRAFIGVLAGGPIGATAFFNLTRRYQKPR